MIKPFKFWCNKVLPTVYDDALSYYEVLSKATEKLNEVITQINSVTETLSSLVININDELALKADKNNTVITGSLSLGRKDGTTVGSSSSAVGYELTASGVASHAEGNDNVVTGNSAHVEGNGNTVLGVSAHAEGTENTVGDAISAHAEGYDNIVGDGANASHVEGSHNDAIGLASHAEGTGTTASGDESHSEGKGTIALANSQHVQGTFNVADEDGNYLHIVGNGTDEDNRSNAHTLDKEGNAWFAGNVYSGDPGADPYDGLLASKSYVENRLATKANKNNPAFTGYGTFSGYVYSENNKRLATEIYVDNAVSGATGVTVATGTFTPASPNTGTLTVKQIGNVVYLEGSINRESNSGYLGQISGVQLPSSGASFLVPIAYPSQYYNQECIGKISIDYQGYVSCLHLTEALTPDPLHPWDGTYGVTVSGFYLV